MAEAAQGKGGASTKLGGTRPPNVRVMQPPHGSSRMRPRGEGPPSIRSGGLRCWSLSRMPPPGPKGKRPTPSPKPLKVTKVAALDVEALGASVATHVTDACQTLVKQAAATGDEAALAKGRAADHKPALAKAEKVQGNTQLALDQALNLANKKGEERGR